MSRHHFDTIVLGTGPAGSGVATKLASAGQRVAIAERREFGGTCALRGCNPKKVYVNAGALVDSVRRSDGRLAVDPGVWIDWPGLHAFKQQFTQPVVEKKERSLREQGIATFHGAAGFVDSSTMQVGDAQLTADHFVIATGARPRDLDLPGAEHVIHSDAFLDLEDLPARVVFLGGGYVSMEFSHVVARTGRQVTVIERNDRILSGFDPDLVDQLTESSRQSGIDFRFGAAVEAIEAASAGGQRGEKLLQLAGGDRIACDLIVHGAGRVPNIDALQLGRGGVESEKRGVVVDEHLRSPSNPAVYALGDCAATAAPPLTPSANEDARVVVANLTGDQPHERPDYGAVPRVAFTTPAIASVGVSQQQAEQQGLDVAIHHQDASTWGSVRKLGGPAAGHKVLVERASDRIVGAHLLGPSAEETINLFALAIKHGLTASQFSSTLFAFPTFASDARTMV